MQQARLKQQAQQRPRAPEARRDHRTAGSGSGKPSPSSAPSRHIGAADGAFGFRTAFVSHPLVPRNHPGHGPHDQDSRETNQRMHGWAASDLGQDEMTGEGKEDAETEY